ncbi:MAG TPA: hypothetical protein VEB66_02215 [Opitutaceae bacterium]|nr:hypothetical protein [Opitutaceae bacterium]
MHTPAAPRIILAAGALLLAGCTTTYQVQVDAIAQAAPTASTAQSYEIKNTNPRVDEDSLRYKEVASYVKTALSGKGMYEAPPGAKADVVVNVDYGMEPPRVKYETETYPIFAQVGGGVRYVQMPITDRNGRIIGYQTVAVYDPPRTEIIGYEEQVKPVIVYEKFLKISARENAEASEGRPTTEVWSVNVSAEDESKDIRKYLPILASATADYIGTNTQEQKPVKIKEDDEVVGFIKKGM